MRFMVFLGKKESMISTKIECHATATLQNSRNNCEVTGSSYHFVTLRKVANFSKTLFKLIVHV